MLKGFEHFKKSSVHPRWASEHKELRATVSVKGAIILNEPARAFFGGAPAVDLYYNQETQVIALVPSVKSADSFTLNSNSINGAGARISCKGFLDHYQIPYDMSRRYIPVAEKNMLLIDLKVEGQPLLARRGSGRKKSEE